MTTINIVGVPLSGTTGTGSFVGSNSPSLVTPTLGAALATSINFGASALGIYQSRVAWTPVATFATPGNLSVSYATQNGYYMRIGDQVYATFYCVFTPTYTTASGNLYFTGLPVNANASINYTSGSCFFLSAITFPAGTTSLCTIMTGGSQAVYTAATGSAAAVVILTTTQYISGVQYNVQGTIAYMI